MPKLRNKPESQEKRKINNMIFSYETFEIQFQRRYQINKFSNNQDPLTGIFRGKT